MGVVVDLQSRGLTPGEHRTEADVLNRAARFLRKWERELPTDSEWRYAFNGIAGHMESSAQEEA